MPAYIGAAGALSHSPLINTAPPAADEPAIRRYRDGTLALGAAIAAAHPDVVIVIGQDHLRSLFYDLMPPFVIATGKIEGWGDWGTHSGPLRGMPELARHLHRNLLSQGFDIACSYDLKVDHGITQPLQLMGLDPGLPILPILINTGAPPLPAPRRCYAFGQALARAIGEHEGPIRVAIIASGGISHDPPAGNVESTEPADAERVASLIDGRATVVSGESARRARLIESVEAGRFPDSIQPEWDRMILDHFASGNASALASELTEEGIGRDGGSGGQEIRTWLAVAGACGGAPAEILTYEPIDYLITGMGAVRFMLPAE